MSTVTALEFRNRVLTAFDTFWADRTQIAPPNVEFDPDQIPTGETAWVRLFILGSDEGQDRYSNSVARNHFRRAGRFTVEVYVREGADTDEAYALAEAAIEFLESPGIDDSMFSEITPPQEFGRDGAWFQVAVSCTWVYWTDRAA